MLNPYYHYTSSEAAIQIARTRVLQASLNPHHSVGVGTYFTRIPPWCHTYSIAANNFRGGAERNIDRNRLDVAIEIFFTRSAEMRLVQLVDKRNIYVMRGNGGIYLMDCSVVEAWRVLDRRPQLFHERLNSYCNMAAMGW